MAAVDLSVGGTTYTTLAQAEAYMGKRVATGAWDNASTDDQAAALMMACRALENLHWLGYPTVTTQPLQWPRAGIYSFSGILGGYAYMAGRRALRGGPGDSTNRRGRGCG
jgi:hypothetical protein